MVRCDATSCPHCAPCTFDSIVTFHSCTQFEAADLAIWPKFAALVSTARRVQSLLSVAAKAGFARLLDAMGHGSAAAQNLYSPITTYDKLLQHGDQVNHSCSVHA